MVCHPPDAIWEGIRKPVTVSGGKFLGGGSYPRNTRPHTRGPVTSDVSGLQEECPENENVHKKIGPLLKRFTLWYSLQGGESIIFF